MSERRLNVVGGLVLIWLLSTPVPADVMTVGHVRPDSSEERRDAYFLELLEEALEASRPNFGDYELVEAPVGMTQSRAMHEMRSGRYVDVVWSMTDRTREARFRPVRIPLLRGLLGLRVPVVASGNEGVLEGITSLEDLRGLTPGQGHDWPDTRILKANGILVETASHYEGLFRMLARGRVDFVPRGVSEVWAERRIYRRYGLSVADKGPLILYPAPIYFFVAPENEELAERLEQGLRELIRSGRFQTLFERHPANREALRLFFSAQRRLIRLNNPGLSEETPLDDPSLWFGPIFRQLNGQDDA